jgi:hypothetical protein
VPTEPRRVSKPRHRLLRQRGLPSIIHWRWLTYAWLCWRNVCCGPPGASPLCTSVVRPELSKKRPSFRPLTPIISRQDTWPSLTVTCVDWRLGSWNVPRVASSLSWSVALRARQLGHGFLMGAARLRAFDAAAPKQHHAPVFNLARRRWLDVPLNGIATEGATKVPRFRGVHSARQR